MAGRGGAVRAGRAYVELFADSSALVRGLKQARRRLMSFGRSLSTIGKTMSASGLFAAAPIALATKSYMGFSDAMLTVRAVTQATQGEYEKLTQRANELGAATSFTTTQIANAMVELGRAGFSTGEIDASIASMLDLARATGTELPRAAEIASATLRGFNLSASDMGRVSDVLVATANTSATTMEDLGEAMKYAAPIAESAGMSLEDTAKAMGTLANMGIKGSMAGTSLRQAMVRLADSKIQKKLGDHGVAALDASGNMRKLGDVMVDIGKAMAGMSNAERLDWMKQLFGMRAITAGIKLATSDFDRLNEAIDKSSGTARAQAAMMDSEIGGVWRRLTSAVDVAANAIGKALAPKLMQIGEALRQAVVDITQFIEQNQELVIAVTGVVAGMVIFGPAIAGMGAAITATATVLGGFISLLTTVGTVAGALVAGGPLTAIALALAAVELATGGVSDAVGALVDTFGMLGAGIRTTMGSISKAIAAGDLTLALDILVLDIKIRMKQLNDVMATGFEQLKSTYNQFRWLSPASAMYFGKADVDPKAAGRRLRKITDMQMELAALQRRAATPTPPSPTPTPVDPALAAAVTGALSQQSTPGLIAAAGRGLGSAASKIGGGLWDTASGLAEAAATNARDWAAKLPSGLATSGGLPDTDTLANRELATAAARSMETRGTFSSVAALRMGGMLGSTPAERTARGIDELKDQQSHANKRLDQLVDATKTAKLVFTGQLP